MKWSGVLPWWWRLTEPAHRRTALMLANAHAAKRRGKTGWWRR